MNTVYQFMSDSPILTFLLGIWVVLPICLAPFKLVNRLIRSANIRAQGWPPPHLDADGDHRSEPDND